MNKHLDAGIVEEEGDIITLYNIDGEEVDFVEAAYILYKENYYSILQPVETPDDMEPNETLVFKVTPGEDDEIHLDIELDDEIIDGVFKEYNRILDEKEGKK
ncbi:MAG: DUF1292 domain-containing protein [Coprobacillus sp.]|nr:DUF1292 domain-containing protein [Coprobacillus sp.]